MWRKEASKLIVEHTGKMRTEEFPSESSSFKKKKKPKKSFCVLLVLSYCLGAGK